MKVLSLKDHASSKCYVTIEENGIINFISYTTVVIKAVPYGIADIEGKELIDKTSNYGDIYVIECTGLYSPTTKKQITWFLREYFGDIVFDSMKEIAGDKNKRVVANHKRAVYW